MWPHELYNRAAETSLSFQKLPSASILACPLQKVGPDIFWSFIVHLYLDQFTGTLFSLVSQAAFLANL